MKNTQFKRTIRLRIVLLDYSANQIVQQANENFALQSRKDNALLLITLERLDSVKTRTSNLIINYEEISDAATHLKLENESLHI
jgi:hypothetical protein